jgi:hypothetical protein
MANGVRRQPSHTAGTLQPPARGPGSKTPVPRIQASLNPPSASKPGFWPNPTGVGIKR